MLASIAVNLKNIYRRITEILPIDLNHDFFLNFPTLLKCNSRHVIAAK